MSASYVALPYRSVEGEAQTDGSLSVPQSTDKRHILDLYDDYGYWRREAGKDIVEVRERHKIPIFVTVSITRVDAISSASSSFKVRLALYVQMQIDLKEKKLGHLVQIAQEGETGKLSLSVAQTKELLKAGVSIPKLNFMNTTEFESLEPEAYRIYGRPTETALDCVHWNCTFSATFRQVFKLHCFPFDHQKLVMELQLSDPLEWDQFHLIVHSVQFRRGAVVDLEEWDMHEPQVVQRTPTNRRVDVELLLSRNSGYYLWNVVFILCLLSLLSLTAFTADYRHTDSRVSLVLTLLLTCVAYKFSLVDVLPRLSYSTLLDSYMLRTLTGLCAICVACCGATVWESNAEDWFPELAIKMEASEIDNIFGCLSFLMLICVKAPFFIKLSWSRYSEPHVISAKDFQEIIDGKVVEKQWLCHHFMEPFFFK